MFKNLKMLLKLRSWLKSDTLKVGGLVGVLGAIQTFIGTDDGMKVLDLAAGFVGLSTGTLTGGLLGIIGLAMIGLRAKTEWSLGEKNADAHKAVSIASTNQRGFSTVDCMGLALTMGVALCLAVACVAQEQPAGPTSELAFGDCSVLLVEYPDGGELPELWLGESSAAVRVTFNQECAELAWPNADVRVTD